MTWVALIVGSVLQPQEVARTLLAQNLPRLVRWQAFALAPVLSTLLSSLTVLLAGQDTPFRDGGIIMPFASTLAELAIDLLAVVVMTSVGQLAGGKGRFDDALLLVAWIQGMLLLLLILQCGAILLVPVLFLPITAFGGILLFWLLTHFTLVLHGFQSALRVFFAILGVFFLVGVALAPLLQPLLS